MATTYTDIAANQVAGANFPGPAGLVALPAGTGFNDPVKELGSSTIVTAVHTMLGTEAANDIIRIVLLGQGAVVDPVNSDVGNNGAATTLTISVGDTDTVGATVTADTKRYSDSISVAADTSATTSLKFAGGTALNAPAEITDDPVWVQAKILTCGTPVAGKVLVFRLHLTDNR